MKWEDFERAIRDAGWIPAFGYATKNLRDLHEKLWPVIAELEHEIKVLENEQ